MDSCLHFYENKYKYLLISLGNSILYIFMWYMSNCVLVHRQLETENWLWMYSSITLHQLCVCVCMYVSVCVCLCRYTCVEAINWHLVYLSTIIHLNLVRRGLSLNLECTNDLTELAGQKCPGIFLSLPSITHVIGTHHGSQLLHGC